MWIFVALHSILLRHIGHCCPKATILSLLQRLACPHGIHIHVSVLRKKTRHIYVLYGVQYSFISHSSDSLDGYTSCVLMFPTVWLIAWRNSLREIFPSRSFCFKQILCSPIFEFVLFLGLLISLPWYKRLIPISVSLIISLRCVMKVHIRGWLHLILDLSFEW